jgi:hypothetical protein
MQASIEISERALLSQIKDTEILQRAYIAAIPRDVVPYHPAGNTDDDNIACNVGLKNVGHLPARNVAYIIHHRFIFNSGLAEFAPLEGQCEGNVVLPAGIEMKKGLAFPIKRKEFDENRKAADNQSGWLYVFGRVEYTDGFNTHRWTEFCFRYSMAAAGDGYNIAKSEARYHEHGNKTDEG